MSQKKKVVAALVVVVAAGALSWWIVEGMKPAPVATYEVSPFDGRRAVIAFYDDGLEAEQLAMIDRETGARLWQRELPEGGNDFFSSGGLLSDLNVSQKHGLVLVQASSREEDSAWVTAMRVDTGETAWERELPAPGRRAGGGLDLHGDTLVTIEGGMGLRVLDVATGEELWSRSKEDDSSYRVLGDFVLVSGLMMTVHRLRTGDEIGTFEARGAICHDGDTLHWIDYGSGADPNATHTLMSFDLRTAEVRRGPGILSGLGIGSWTRCGTYDGDLVFSGWNSRKGLWAAYFMRVDAETGSLAWAMELPGRIDSVIMNAPAAWAYLNGPLTRYVPVVTMRQEESGVILARGHSVDLDTGAIHSEGEDMESDRIGSVSTWRVGETSTWILQGRDGEDNVVAAFDAERGVLTGAVKTKGLSASTMRAPGGVLWMHAFGLFSGTNMLGWYAAKSTDLAPLGAGEGAPLQPGGEWVMGWLGAPK